MRPVVVLLLCAWLLGIILGVAAPNWRSAIAVVVGVCLLGHKYQPRTAVAAAVFLAAGLGFIYGSGVRPATTSACVGQTELTGRIIARPDIREQSVRYVVEDERGCLFFVYAERWPVYERDSVVTVSGGRYRDQAAIVAEEPSFGQYLVRSGVAGVWSYPKLTPRAVAQGDRVYRGVRERVHRVFVEPDASLVGAILLADRGQLPADTMEYFRRTSLIHILSISGTHISLLAIMIFFLVGLLPLPPFARTGIVIALLWGYVWFVGAPVSAVRAGFFWSVTLLALRLGLLVSLPTAILLALTLMLTWQPRMVLDIGLQLSFLAVVGIGAALFITKPWRARLPGPGRGIVVAALVSLGATALTWPLVSYYFNIVSTSAVLANLLIIPSVPIIMAGSFIAITLSYVSELGGYLAALSVHAAIVWMMKVAEVLGRWPGMWLAVTVPGWFLGLYYSGVVVLLLAVVRWQKRNWREIWE